MAMRQRMRAVASSQLVRFVLIIAHTYPLSHSFNVIALLFKTLERKSMVIQLELRCRAGYT